MVSWQVPLPEQAPLQPLKLEPAVPEALSVTPAPSPALMTSRPERERITSAPARARRQSCPRVPIRVSRASVPRLTLHLPAAAAGDPAPRATPAVIERARARVLRHVVDLFGKRSPFGN